MKLARLVATGIGIGYINNGKGAGTVAALVYGVIWYGLQKQGLAVWASLCIIAGVFIIGVWSASVVEQEWGKDHRQVVIDEILGIFASLFLLPVSYVYYPLAFIFFRLFDITKPLIIRKSENLPSGWGVMTDDLLAGICSNLLVQFIARSNLW